MKSEQIKLLELQNIELSYNGFKVLKNINYSVNKSEIIAIVGEHGAGKTSLCNIISGIEKPINGDIIFNGKRHSFFSRETAMDNGVEIITQQFPMLDNFSVADNLFSHIKNKTGYFRKNKTKITENARKIIQQYGFNIDPNIKIRNLKLSDRILIEIIKHIYTQPSLLILDEALQKLSQINFTKIINILKKLREEGTTILYVTHRIDDIYEFADKVTIIRNGELIITDRVKNIDKINLIKLAYTQIMSEDMIDSEKEEFYQLLKYNKAILEKLPVILLALDRHNNIKLINHQAKSFFSKTDKFLGKNIEYLFEENPDIFTLIKDGLLKSNEKNYFNLNFTTKSDKLRVNIKTHPIYDGSFLIGSIIILEDITQREELREKVILSERLASTGLLAAGVAHEINNPLTAVYNYLEYLNLKLDDTALKETVDNLCSEINTIAHITSNLMTFANKPVDWTDKVEINSLVQETINLLNFNAQYQNIKIYFTKSREDIWLIINPIEFKQILLNLIRNSFEAMNDGGEIEIVTSLDVKENSREVEIKVSDNGPGINKKYIEKVFSPFFSTKENTGNNMGLGLSVVYNIINKYNGTINYSNKKPSGCIFTIRFNLK